MLIDNATVYAAGFAAGKGEGGGSRFERSLMDLRIVENHSRPKQTSETVQSGATQIRTLTPWVY